MRKETKDKLAEINAKKEQIKELVSKGKLDEAEAEKAKLCDLQRAFNLLADLEEEERQGVADGPADQIEVTPGTGSKEKPTFAALAKAIVNKIGQTVGRRQMDDADRAAIRNAMTEGSDPDGGLTVPKDIATRIMELRRSDDNLEQYVNVEPVRTMSGSRVIEKAADATPWSDIDEGGEYTNHETPQLRNIAYKITKKGGKLQCSLELLADTAENIMAYLMKWIAKKTRATRNHRILACLDELTRGKEVAVSTLDDLKDIFNVKLDPAIARTSAIWVNQDGFNWLDKLTDKDGKYILQPNPADATRTMLFGKYQVHTLSNKVLKTVAGGSTVTYPMYCGDMAEAVTLFDREFMTVESSKEAGDSWDKDMLSIKVRDRFDVKAVDDDAIVKAKITVSTAG